MLDKKRGLIGKKNQGVVLIKKWGEKQKSTDFSKTPFFPEVPFC